MKIKNSLIRKILLGIVEVIEKIQCKLIKIKTNKKKKSIKEILKLLKFYTKQVEKVGIKSELSDKITITSLEQMEFYVDNCNGTIMKLEEAIKIVNTEVKRFKDEISIKTDKIVDEYMNRKYIIDNMIKNVYFKAKQLVITISGTLLRIDDKYRKTIDRFLEIRHDILKNSYNILKENKFLLKFILDNNIDTDQKFDECADILTKMYITEKEHDLYNDLGRFTKLFCTDNNIMYI